MPNEVYVVGKLSPDNSTTTAPVTPGRWLKPLSKCSWWPTMGELIPPRSDKLISPGTVPAGRQRDIGQWICQEIGLGQGDVRALLCGWVGRVCYAFWHHDGIRAAIGLTVLFTRLRGTQLWKIQSNGNVTSLGSMSISATALSTWPETGVLRQTS